MWVARKTLMQEPPSGEPSCRRWLLAKKPVRSLCVVACLLTLTGPCGCRVLRRNDTREVSTVRQFSLRGWDALEQRKFADAESLFVEALRQSSNDDRAQWGISEVLWERGERTEATRHMAKAVELSGANPDLLVRLGQMYLEQDDLDRAAAQADAVLRSHRSNPAAWALKADVLRGRKQYAAAIDAYHRALIYRPDWPDVQVTVAQLYRLSNRPQRALATLDRLSDQRSATQVPPRAFLLRAQSLADLGQHEAALLCLRQTAPILAADQSALLVEFAQVQYQLGDLLAARQSLARALKDAPESTTALALQARLDEAFAQSGGVGSNVTVRTVSAPARQ